MQAIHIDMTPWCSFIICVLLNCSEAQGTKTSQGQDHEHRPFIVWQFGPKRHFLQHVPDISVLETGAHLHEVPVAMNAKGAGYWLFSFDPFGEGVMEWCALKEGGDVVVQFKIKWTNDSRNFYQAPLCICFTRTICEKVVSNNRTKRSISRIL